jgi:heme-degrading monooxygenase HmoA
LGTELYRDAARVDRFLTIDRWRNEEDWQSFVAGRRHQRRFDEFRSGFRHN